MIESVQFLHASNRDAWRLYPEFERRVRCFAAEYDSEINIEQFLNHLRMSFVSDKPTVLMIAGVDQDFYPVAHMVACAELWWGRPVVTIAQLQSDEKIPQALWDESQRALDIFCATHQIQRIQMAARNKAVARLFRRQGFQGEKILMSRGTGAGKVPAP